MRIGEVGYDMNWAQVAEFLWWENYERKEKERRDKIKGGKMRKIEENKNGTTPVKWDQK